MDKVIAIAVANSVLEHTGYIGTGAKLVPCFGTKTYKCPPIHLK